MIKFEPIDEMRAKVAFDTAIPSSATFHVKRWIEEACSIMKVTKTLLPQILKVKIVNHKVCLPQTVEEVVAVWIGNTRIHRASFTERVSSGRYYRDNEITVWQAYLPLVKETFNDAPTKSWYQESIDLIQSKVVNAVDYSRNVFYKVEGSNLSFNIDEAIVEVCYLDVPRDSRGDIMIVTDDMYKEAILAWVEYKAINRGLIKGNSGEKLALFQRLSASAIANVSMITPEDAQRIYDNSLGLIKDDYYERGYL